MSDMPSNVVRRGEPSRSAHWVAALRAAHQLLDEPLVLPDPIALPLFDLASIPRTPTYAALRPCSLPTGV